MTGQVSWWSFALRNLLQSARRTGFTVAAIALGFTAVTVFGGFTSYIFSSLEESQIYLTSGGHLTLHKAKLEEDPKAPIEERYISSTELAELMELIKVDREVAMASPQLHTRGLLSNGDLSSVFVGTGRVWTDAYAIRRQAKGIARQLELFQGTPLQDDSPERIGVGRGLAQRLQIGLEGSGILVTPTLEGHMNALDVQVAQFSDTPSEWLKHYLVVAPLSLMQLLLDTDSVDRISILLDRGSDVEAARRRLLGWIWSKGKREYWINTWQESSPLYTKSTAMFRILFLFVFGIILVISILIVVNTTNMSVTERTREIGTLRALGMRQRGVLAIFAREGLLLGLAGSLAGTAATASTVLLMRWADIQWTPPTIERTIPLRIELVPEYLAWTLLGMVTISVVASLLAARKAARMSIVEGLGHV